MVEATLAESRQFWRCLRGMNYESEHALGVLKFLFRQLVNEAVDVLTGAHAGKYMTMTVCLCLRMQPHPLRHIPAAIDRNCLPGHVSVRRQHHGDRSDFINRAKPPHRNQVGFGVQVVGHHVRFN